MVRETDLVTGDGRTLHVYDCADDVPDGLAVFWHHGTPNLGSPPQPLLEAAARLGVRWVSYDRPSYGGSSPHVGRDIASAAGDVSAIADALGIAQFAVFGHSGGAVHALACAELLRERVLAAVCCSGLAPFDAHELDWFAGIGASGAAELRAAVRGREALAELLAASEFDPEQFTAADYEALEGPWGWLGTIAGQALEGGVNGMVDDDRAYVTPWGFRPGPTAAPVLLVHGDADRMVPSAHSEWLAARNPSAELWLLPGAGHISALSSTAEAALEWLVRHAK